MDSSHLKQLRSSLVRKWNKNGFKSIQELIDAALNDGLFIGACRERHHCLTVVSSFKGEGFFDETQELAQSIYNVITRKSINDVIAEHK